MLEQSIRNNLKEKDILLMTHLVLGYPSFEDNKKMIQAMANAGVEMIELQIPYSEPSADGPVILKANSDSLESGTTVEACFKFAEEVCAEFPEITFLFMTYYNIPFMYGEKEFVQRSKDIGIKGFIVPDLPLEESAGWLALCEEKELNSIFIFTPTNTDERLKELAAASKGFVYCVGRRGVTGKKTSFDQSLADQIQRFRSASNVPIALGFGVQSPEDVQFLVGKADIAVIGSKMIQLQQTEGVEAAEQFLKEVRA